MPFLGTVDPQMLWAAARAFAVTLVLTPVCRDVFSSYSIVDKPDQTRKLHGRPIPRVGGIAIFIGYFLAFLFLGDTPDGERFSLAWRLLPAALLVFGVGLIDDFVGLKPFQKLAGQFVATVLAYGLGVRVLHVAGYSTDSALSFPLTIAWLLLCTNAFNLVDGLDGLAAGVGVFATLTIFAGALLHGNHSLALATLPLAGAILGFLCFNYNPATIFLGDGGSMLIGFLLGCYGAVWGQKSVTLLGMTAPLIALSIPLLDVVLCILRRFLRNRPIFGADRGHIHHRLIDRGLTPRRAVLVIYCLSGLAAAVSLLQSYLANVFAAAVAIAVFGIVVWAAIRFLGYAEFVLAGRILRTGGFQRLITAQMEIEGFRKSLAAATSAEQCWQVLCDWYRPLGFDAVSLYTPDTVRRTAPAQSAEAWILTVPLSETVRLEFLKLYGAANSPVVVTSLTETLKMHLSPALFEAAEPLPAPRSAAAAARAPKITPEHC